MSLLTCLLLLTMVGVQCYEKGDNEKSMVIIQLEESHIDTSNEPLLRSKYFLMSSERKINGFYNYIFLTDLHGPHMVLLQSEDECRLSVDFEALKDKNVKGSVKFLKKESNESCSIIKDNYVLMRLGGLSELSDNNKDTIKSYNFDKDYAHLKITHYSSTGRTRFFNVTFSNADSTIKIDIGYHGERTTLKKLPNNLVGPLVALMEMQVSNLSVLVTSRLALKMSFANPKINYKFHSSLNRFFSDLETPGIFRTYNISLLPSTNAQSEQDNSLSNSALFWKAVAYTDKPPRRSSQIMADVDPHYNCSEEKLSKDLVESVIIDMMNLSQIKTYDCSRIVFVALNKDSSFNFTKYMDWSGTFGFTSYYSNVMPIGVVSSIAIAYAVPLFVGILLFLLSKTSHRNRSPSTYSVISVDNNEENVDDVEKESLYNESSVSC